MKNRYKILIACCIILSLLVLAVILLALSFQRVGINQYGLPYHNLWKTMTDTVPKTRGRYFIGVDNTYLLLPKGLIKFEISLTCLSKDKSPVDIDMLFLGTLIESQIITVAMNYGGDYETPIRVSIEQAVREALEQYNLVQIISNRTAVEFFIQSKVINDLNNNFPFLYARLASVGAIQRIGSTSDKALVENPSIYNLAIDVLTKLNRVKKESQFYASGGQQVLTALEKEDSQIWDVFYKSAKQLDPSPNNSTIVEAAFEYLVSSSVTRAQPSLNFLL